MGKKQLILILVITAALSLGACSRASSPPPTPTPTPGDSVIQVIFEQATLTVQAAAGNVVNPPETSGNNPLAIDPTPTSSWPIVTATPTTSSVPVGPQTVPTSYTLHEGEFPFCLARRFNINFDTLMSANGLVGDTFSVGQTLTIPQGAGPYVGVRARSPHPTQYTVGSSDTFYSIACKFGDVYPEAIAQANGMGIDAVLTVGQTLQIP
ncbi:MAG: LysM peptidoglycan-binding domain-containing protein [Chloroflexi bacterium]|nr:LysM peptidoglycan-binding domain-containing protein [Chloroflexota bacterium]